MAETRVATDPVTGKGLERGALGLWGNVVIGLASTAPAYSLAATLGYVVLAVGDRAPAMFIVAFVPMLFIAVAYRELNRSAPDCGTTFTWGTKAFGPWVGWMGGWGLAVSAIIVLANVAEIAGIYLLDFLGFDSAADSLTVRVLFGVAFIAVMTWVSYRGIVITGRLQNVLVTIQFVILAVFSVVALGKVFSDSAGSQAVNPSWEWFSPRGLDSSAIAEAVILCIFIYWGWDSCLAVNEETRNADVVAGKAAIVSTVILLATYLMVAVAVQAYAGFGTDGIGLGNEENLDDVLTVLGDPVFGGILASLLLLTVAISAASSTQTTILPTARTSLSMARAGAMPESLGQVHPRFLTPHVSTILMGVLSIVWYVGLTIVSENILFDSIAALGLMIAFYYGLTGFACTIYYRHEVTKSIKSFFLIGVGPLLGGLMLAAIFFKSCWDLSKPENSESGDSWFGLGPPLVIGLGFLLLGAVLMLLWRIEHKDFFRRPREVLGMERAGPTVTDDDV
jgi:amino acid transporter